MKRKILSILLIFLMLVTTLFSFTGCSVNHSDNQNGDIQNSENNENSKSSSKKLIDVVQIGDYVNYSAKAEDEYKYEHYNMGAYNSKFSSTDKMKWRVWDVDKETGKIELFGITNITSPQMNSVYAVETLNKIANVYSHGKGATGARSITLEDIERYTTYDVKDSSVCKTSSYASYGDVKSYELSSSITYPVTNENGEITELKTSGTQDVTQTYYSVDNIEEYINNDKIKELISNKRIWLASLAYDCMEKGFSIQCRTIYRGSLSGGSVQFYDGKWHNHTTSNVGVIVSLDPDITTLGQNEKGVWQLELK